ncbi:MDR family MFS transporter [Paenibacillus elgii]|uniref:MDR family MFS transporter n=1 Tax=Paenibacillus elgii TaxID=189691 RepID=UPI0013D31483|nr:MFS transporter [Paenibacillus elgii]
MTGFRKYHKNLKIRIYDVFINGLCSTMYLPFMGIYFADRLGAELTGILMIITVLFGFSAGLYGGYFADLSGRKKIMVTAASLRLMALIVMLVANTLMMNPVILTFISILIISACSGASDPVSEAMVVDVTNSDNRKSVYNFLYWFRNLSSVLGGVAGGFLFKDHLQLILLISAFLSALSLVLVSVFITETYTPPIQRTLVKRRVLHELVVNYIRVSKDRTFMIFTLATLLFFSLEFQMSNYIGIRLGKELPSQIYYLFGFGFNLDGVKLLGLLRAENTFVVVAFTLLIGLLVKRYKDTKVLTAGLLIYTAGYFILGFSNVPLLLLSAMLIATVGEIMFWPVRQKYLAELIPEDARSSYMAVNSLVFQGARVLASLSITLGAVITSFFMSTLYLFIGLISIYLFHMVIGQIKRSKTVHSEEGVITS